MQISPASLAKVQTVLAGVAALISSPYGEIIVLSVMILTIGIVVNREVQQALWYRTGRKLLQRVGEQDASAGFDAYCRQPAPYARDLHPGGSAAGPEPPVPRPGDPASERAAGTGPT